MRLGAPYRASGWAISRISAGSTVALDGHEFLTGAAAGGDAGRHHTGDLVALDLAERDSLVEFAGTAIGVRDGGSTAGAAREAAVDPITVRIIVDDQNALLGAGGARG